MTSIKHRVIIETTPDKLFQAITNEQGLSSWWTKAQVAEKPARQIKFFFGPSGEHVVEMATMEVVPNRKVSWKCTAGPWEMTDQFIFLIEPDARGSALTFENSGWPEQDDFYAHCNAKWGFFLAVSLKSHLETGAGQPHPMDPNI
ncbi:MAG: SRPBCC family protein [Oceanococcus sp.]